MIKRFNKKEGFTLIELMIVVAIIGILAAIAIPNFLSMQLRAKRSEVPTNLAAIRTAENAYFQEYDVFLDAALKPTDTLGTAQHAWVKSSGSDWSLLGWQPDGEPRGNYEVSGASPTNFTATGLCDVDGDGETASFSGTRDTKVTMGSNNDIY